MGAGKPPPPTRPGALWGAAGGSRARVGRCPWARRARNRCLALASSDRIAFLDADDLWHPEKLEIQLEHLARSGACLVFADAFVVDGRGRVLGRYFQRWPPSRSPVHEALVGGNFIPQCTVLARREVLQFVGRFDHGLRIACDYDLWLRVTREAPVAFLERPLASWRVHGSNLTGDFRLAYDENVRVYRSLLDRATGDSDAYRRRVRRALTILCWKWGFRCLWSGEGFGAAFARLRKGFRWSGGPLRGVLSLLRFLSRQS